MSEKSDEVEHEDGYTTVKAYSPTDSYDDIVTSKKSIAEDFAKHEATTCNKCGLAARNESELRDHLSHAHG